MTAPTESKPWASWVLILIDVQKDFWTPDHKRAFPDFPHRISDLLALCRQQGIEVVHVHSRFRVDRSDWMPTYKTRGRIPCIEGTGGDAVLPFAAPEADESTFIKQTFDAFQRPEVTSHLRTRGKGIVLTAGLETSYCVSLTAAGASQQGFLTLVLEDCCADDPAFAKSATSELLARYENRVFFRSSIRDLIDTRAHWASKLAAIEAPEERKDRP